MQSDSDRAEPNMTPILDMVFQLITFFMLVINFKASDFNRDLVLPVVGSAAPIENNETRDLLVLNINAEGSVTVRGKLESNFEKFINIESQVIRSTSSLAAGQALPVTVIVRADREISFRSLMRVIDACKKHGFDKFDFMVLRKSKQD